MTGEPLSPFVSWEDETLSLEPPELSTRWLEELRDPAAVVERLMDARALAQTIAGSLALIALGTGVFALVLRLDLGASAAALSALRLVASMLLALAAALGPIQAASLVMAARVPLGRLVGVLLGAVAAGSLILAPLAPLVRLMHQRDLHMGGPLSLVAAFGVAALVAGFSMRALLFALARASVERPLTASEDFRVGVVARLSCVFLAFTVALALWTLGAF